MNPVSYFLYSEASGLADPAGTEAPCSQADQFLEMVQEAPRMSSLGKPANPEPTPQDVFHWGWGWHVLPSGYSPSAPITPGLGTRPPGAAPKPRDLK